MYYIINLLAAILIGISVGALLGPRIKTLFIGSLVAIVLGIVTLVTGSWIFLAIGTAVLLITQGMRRDTYSRA